MSDEKLVSSAARALEEMFLTEDDVKQSSCDELVDALAKATEIQHYCKSKVAQERKAELARDIVYELTDHIVEKYGGKVISPSLNDWADSWLEEIVKKEL